MTASVPTRDGIFSNVDEIAYHADRGSLSVSGAKLLLPPSCPAKFKERMDNPPKPKREYDFGHLAHRLLLGKGGDLMVIDAPNYKTKAAQEARDKAHANGKVPVLPFELAKAEAMVRKVLDHPRAAVWFDPRKGEAEKSVYAADPVTDVRLRMRADWLWFGSPDGRLWVIDYKTSTTANPEELVRKFWQLGYFMQSAWYTHVLRLANIAADAAFVFLCQEKDPPYLVTPIEYDAEAMAEGARLNRDAIDLYVRCRDRAEWPGYPGAEDVLPLSLPPYGFRQSTINDLLTNREDFDE